MTEHCRFCGSQYLSNDWPRACLSCDKTTWLNPVPVVVILHKVIGPKPTIKTGGLPVHPVGAVIAKRAIEPANGKWGLISGYMNIGESAEAAAVREFKEETNLDVETRPRYLYSFGNDDNQLMLFFVVDKPMSYARFLTGKVCPENEELGIAWKGQELAFPSHSDFLKKWLAGDFNYE